MSQPGLTSFEPAFADEVAVMLRWAFEHLQAPDGGSVYLRLTTRQIPQPEREMTPELAARILAGGYWLVPPEPGAELALVCTGAVAPEALEALAAVREDIPGAGLLLVTSADRLDAGLATARARRERRAAAGAAGPGRRAGHRARRPPGDAVLAGRGAAATASRRWASTGSASRPTSPTSTASTASTPRHPRRLRRGVPGR